MKRVKVIEDLVDFQSERLQADSRSCWTTLHFERKHTEGLQFQICALTGLLC